MVLCLGGRAGLVRPAWLEVVCRSIENSMIGYRCRNGKTEMLKCSHLQSFFEDKESFPLKSGLSLFAVFKRNIEA